MSLRVRSLQPCRASSIRHRSRQERNLAQLSATLITPLKCRLATHVNLTAPICPAIGIYDAVAIESLSSLPPDKQQSSKRCRDYCDGEDERYSDPSVMEDDEETKMAIVWDGQELAECEPGFVRLPIGDKEGGRQGSQTRAVQRNAESLLSTVSNAAKVIDRRMTLASNV